MKTKYLMSVLVVMFLIGIGVTAMALSEKVESSRVEDNKKAKVTVTGLEDQTGVAVTIYNVNLGLVKDQRQIKLSRGTGELRFMDVASQIIPIDEILD